MKENEVKGLTDLKGEYRNKLENLKGYTDLQKEFEEKSLQLLKNEMQSRGISMPDVSMAVKVGGCGFCTICVSSCTACVFHVAE